MACSGRLGTPTVMAAVARVLSNVTILAPWWAQDRQVQCVAGTQAGLVLIGKARGCAEIHAGNRRHDKTFLNQTGELCQAIGAMLGLNLSGAQLTNATRSIATFRASDGFACKARGRRHSCSTSSHLNAAGGFVRRPRRACLSARVDGVVVARCRLSYRLRADALPHAPRDKLNEAIFLVALVSACALENSVMVQSLIRSVPGVCSASQFWVAGVRASFPSAATITLVSR